MDAAWWTWACVALLQLPMEARTPREAPLEPQPAVVGDDVPNNFLPPAVAGEAIVPVESTDGAEPDPVEPRRADDNVVRASALVPAQSRAARLTPPELVTQLLAPPADQPLPGRPLTLIEVLSRQATRTQHLDHVYSYWRLAAAVGQYHVARDEWSHLASLAERMQAQRVAEPTGLAVRRVAAEARVRETELLAIAAQSDLADRIKLAANDQAPLAADRLHVGGYRTLFEAMFASRPAPTRLRAIDRTLPVRRKAIEARTEAVQAALDSLTAVEEAYAARQEEWTTVVEMIEAASAQRRAFLSQVLEYNLQIAEYAMNVAHDQATAPVLAGMLIRSTSVVPGSGATAYNEGSEAVDGSERVPSLLPNEAVQAQPLSPAPAGRGQPVGGIYEAFPPPATPQLPAVFPDPAGSTRPQLEAQEDPAANERRSVLRPSKSAPSGAADGPRREANYPPLSGTGSTSGSGSTNRGVPTLGGSPFGGTPSSGTPSSSGTSVLSGSSSSGSSTLGNSPYSSGSRPSLSGSTLGTRPPLGSGSSLGDRSPVGSGSSELNSSDSRGSLPSSRFSLPGGRPLPHLSSATEASEQALYAALVELPAPRRTHQLANLLHWDRTLPESRGPAVDLKTYLRGVPLPERLSAVLLYWKARQRAAEYQLFSDLDGKLAELSPLVLERTTTGGPEAMLQLRAVELANRADLVQAEALLIGLEWDLARYQTVLAGQQQVPWHAATLPHGGRYDAKLESQAATVTGTWQVRRWSQSVPQLHAALENRSWSVVQADLGRSETTDAYLRGQQTLPEVLKSIRLQARQSLAFLESLTEYNTAIAQYVTSVLPHDAPVEHLVATLVIE